jgi:hypothetical protein
MQDIIKALPNIEQTRVINAVHRLREVSRLKIHREFGLGGAVYVIASGATRPTDGRGRPRKSEQSTRWLESSSATPRGGTSG